MADAPEKNPFRGMLGLKTVNPEPQDGPQTRHVPDPSPRDSYDTSLSFRTHYDVRRKLRQDCLSLNESMEDYLRSLCLMGLPKDAPRKSGINKSEAMVRVTFKCALGLRRKVRQDALDRDMTVEEYLTSLVLRGRS